MDTSDPILLINSVAGLGGAELNLLDFVSHLDKEEFDPVVLLGGDGPLKQRFQDIGVEVISSHFPFFSRRRPWIYWNSLWNILRINYTRNIALLHVNCDQAIPHAITCARMMCLPSVCYIHDMTRAWFLPRLYSRVFNFWSND